MSEVNIITKLHKSTKRDYQKRVIEEDKVHCSQVAYQFGEQYWDGDRKYGYGGYNYDGRWSSVAQEFIHKYKLTNESSVLDIGCGKGFLLFEIKQILPGISVTGIDISEYAIQNSKSEISQYLRVGDARELPYKDNQFDLVISHATLHNLEIHDVTKALREISRVSRKNAWICVESYRTPKEKVNLLYWQLTCESFFSPTGWKWIFDNADYQHDYEFMFFE